MFCCWLLDWWMSLVCVLLVAIGRFFEWEGRLVARYPYSTLLVTIAVTVFLGYMGVINFAQETRATELYVPEGSSTTADHDRVRDAFGFFPLTVLGRECYSSWIVHTVYL